MPEGLTGFDILVFIVIGLSTILAFARGFTTVALSFAAWIGSLLVASVGYGFIQPYAREAITPVELADFVALGGLFLVTLVILKLIAAQVGGAVKDSPVGFLDRSLGALFGFLRGLVVVSVAYIILAAVLPSDQPTWIAEAKSRPLVAWGADIVSAFAEDTLGERPETTAAGALDEAQRRALEAAEALGADVAETYTKEARKKLDAVINDAVSGKTDKDSQDDNKTR